MGSDRILNHAYESYFIFSKITFIIAVVYWIYVLKCFNVTGA